MNEPRAEERYEEMQPNENQMRQRAEEIQGKVRDSINRAMSTTAESLDKTADRMHEVSRFFREKNADTLKDDLSNAVKKYPGQTLIGAMILGFLFGKAISR